MISSIFGKTTPIGQVLAYSFLFLFYWGCHIVLFHTAFTPTAILYHCSVVGALILGALWVQLTVGRTKITEANGYALLFYCLFVATFPNILEDGGIVFAALLLLFALRRLMGIRTLKDVKRKIFDASCWILLSSLFYEWSLFFLILVYVAIYLYQPKHFKNWAVPLTAMFCMGMIALSVMVIWGDVAPLLSRYQFHWEPRIDFLRYWRNNTKFLIYVGVLLLSLMFSALKRGNSGTGRTVLQRFVGISFLLGIAMVVIGHAQGIAPVVFSFFPAAVFAANAIESIRRDNFREVALILSILAPFILLALRFMET